MCPAQVYELGEGSGDGTVDGRGDAVELRPVRRDHREGRPPDAARGRLGPRVHADVTDGPAGAAHGGRETGRPDAQSRPSLRALVAALALAPPAGSGSRPGGGAPGRAPAKGLDRGPGRRRRGRRARTPPLRRLPAPRRGCSVDGVVGPRTRRALGPLGGRCSGAGRSSAARSAGTSPCSSTSSPPRLAPRPAGRDGSVAAHGRAPCVGFQRAGGLAADGVVGPATMAALRGRAVLDADAGGLPCARPRAATCVRRRRRR